MEKNRAGQFITQPSGYSSFKPAKLPPNPEIVFDAELMKLMSDADRLLGRLDGVTQTLPNPDYFCEKHILDDVTPNKERYKSYAFTKYIDILKAGTEL